MVEFISCSHCGNQVLKEAEICPKCGCRVSSNNIEVIMSENIRQSEIDSIGYSYLILVIFLSFFGFKIGGSIERKKSMVLGIKKASNLMSASAQACYYVALILAILEFIVCIGGLIYLITIL